MAERAAVAALTTDAGWVRARVREAVESRDRLAGELRAIGLDAAAVRREFPAACPRRARLRDRAIAARARDRRARVRWPSRNRRRAPHHRGSVAGDGARARRAARRCTWMRITLFDYGAGNLHSLAKALAATVATCASRPTRAPRWTPTCSCFPASARSSPRRTRSRRRPWRDARRDSRRPAVPRHLPRHAAPVRRERRGRRRGTRRVRRARHRAAHAAHRRRSAGTRIDDAARSAVSRSRGSQTAYYANSFVCRPATSRS